MLAPLRAEMIERQTRRLAGTSIKFTFVPSVETKPINYFSERIWDDIKHIKEGLEYLPPNQFSKCDLMVMTAHGKDLYDPIMTANIPENLLLAIWFWDNHIANLANLRTALAADYIFLSHWYKSGYLSNPVSAMGPHIPLCSAQWSLAEATRIFLGGMGAPRSDKLLVNYIDYPWSKRSAVLNEMKSSLTGANILVMGSSEKDRYFAKSREERALEWLQHKMTIILPAENDLSTRVFDALLAGQVILVPQQIADFDDVIPPPLQEQLGIIRLPDLKMPTISEAAAEGVRIFDRAGEAGARTRCNYVLENHMLVHRVQSILATIRSVADGHVRPLSKIGHASSAGIFLA